MAERLAGEGPVIVTLDRDRCCGFGLCAQISPEVFALDHVRQASVIDERPVAADVITRARSAEASCPQRVIMVKQQVLDPTHRTPLTHPVPDA